jgi:NCS2 family nucleobase:cation symporter-2
MASLYDLDGRPPLKQAFPVGLQHLLALMIGNVAPMMLVAASLGMSGAQSGSLIQYALFVAGWVTLLQLMPAGWAGARLPIMMGTSFTYLAISISIGAKYGMEGIIGAILVGGGVQVLFSLFIVRIKRFFPPLVTGCVVMCLGLTLIPTGIDYFAGGAGSDGYGNINNLLLGAFTLFLIVSLQVFTKGFTRIAAILIGIVGGYLLAVVMGGVDFSTVREAAWFSVPKPLLFGVSFHPEAVIPMALICIITSIQSIGNLSATALSGLNREVSNRELRGGLLAEGIGSIFCGFFNALPTTTYAQNVGIVSLTKAVNRFSLAISAAVLVACGFMPKLSALIVAMPASVLGGAAVLLFATVATTGIQMVSVNGFTNRVAVITALSVGLGMGLFFRPDMLSAFPEWVRLLFASGLPVTALLAFALNILMKEAPKNS